MPKPRPKVFDYAVTLATDGTASIDGGESFVPPPGWTADHLLLAALLRCSIDSLAYHARRAGSTAHSTGRASGRVARRGSDDRHAFVEIDCRIDTALHPPVGDPGELFAKAERDCFVGASLAVEPHYQWRLG